MSTVILERASRACAHVPCHGSIRAKQDISLHRTRRQKEAPPNNISPPLSPQCNCPNGTPQTGKVCHNQAYLCHACNAGYTLNQKRTACAAPSLPALPALPTSPTLSLPPSKLPAGKHSFHCTCTSGFSGPRCGMVA